MGPNSGLHIIIFDEIDAICKARGSVAGSTAVHDTVVNQLLSKIDGVDQLNNILVIGQRWTIVLCVTNFYTDLFSLFNSIYSINQFIYSVYSHYNKLPKLPCCQVSDVSLSQALHPIGHCCIVSSFLKHLCQGCKWDFEVQDGDDTEMFAIVTAHLSGMSTRPWGLRLRRHQDVCSVYSIFLGCKWDPLRSETQTTPRCFQCL